MSMMKIMKFIRLAEVPYAAIGNAGGGFLCDRDVA